MKCPTHKVIQLSLTLFMVVFMVYLGSHGSQSPSPHTQIISLILPQRNSSHENPTINATPSSPLKPYTIIKNKLYYLDEWSNFTPVHRKRLLQPSEAAALQNIDYSNYSDEERQYLESRVPLLVDRARQVKKACMGSPLLDLRIPNIVYDQVHHVIWCPNFKVASTTMMINFLKLGHFNENNPAIPTDLPPEERKKLQFSPRFGAKHFEVFKLYPTPPTVKEKLKVIKESARAITVRHPFTRILSAYRDKMRKERPLPAKFKFRELQKSIIEKYRPATSQEKSQFPTFPEFVQYLIDSSASFRTGIDWRRNMNCWLPFWAQCNVCSMDYNVIMKLETMKEDESFLVTLTNMKELKKNGGEWRHLTNVSSTAAAADFYQQLTTRQMLDLHQRYKLDFDLFGYSIDAYLPLATDAPSRHNL